MLHTRCCTRSAPFDAQHLLEGVFVAVPYLKLIPGIPERPAAASTQQITAAFGVLHFITTMLCSRTAAPSTGGQKAVYSNE
jgi:hypothetical protein